MRKAAGTSLFAAVAAVALTLIAWQPPQTGPKDVLRATLSNGLRVVVLRDPLAPVATSVINYLVGSNEVPAGFPGMAHAEEHMMFRGSPGLSADQLANISAAMGGNFDADTQQTVTQYFFTVPAEDLDVALHIEAIRMQGALDSQDLWEKERGAIEQEVAQDLSNPQFVFYTKLLQTMFQGTPYAHAPLGTRPSFQKTTGAMLKQFHDSWYAPNNAILVIAGDVDPQKTLAQVKTLFASIPAKKLPAKPAVNLQPVKAETLNLTTDLPYGLAVVAFRFPGSDSPDYAACQVLADVLGSERGALYDLVPQGKALGTGFSVSSLPKASLGYGVGAFPAGTGGPALAAEVRNVLADLVKKGAPPELVEASKNHEVADAEFRRNSVSGLAMAWSQALAVDGYQSPDEIVDAIKRVTVGDVNRVARKYLDFNQAITAVLAPQPSGKPISSKPAGGPESFAPKETKPVPLPAWAEQAVKRLEIPQSTLSPVTVVLPNGLKLIVQPETISNTVSVHGHIKNNPDLETPAGKEGVHEVLGELFSYGTTTLDRLTFQKELDDIAADESAGTDFSVRVLPAHFERGVELMADNELRPALPESAFKVIQKQTAASVAGRLKSPDYLVGRAIEQALYPKDDPSQRESTPATISGLSLADVKAYYQHVFRPDLTTIVVIGDITPERARAAVEKYFGVWKAAGPKPETDLAPAPANQPSATVVPDSSRVQDRVTLVETLGINRFNPDYYPLQLGNNVLGGAFYATRLYRELRAQAGLVYFVDSSFQVGRTRATYSISYGCDPPNTAAARALIERELNTMQTAPVTAEELQQAKALVLRQIPLSESSLGSIAGGLLVRATEGMPLDEPIRAAHIYVKLTAADIQAAFKKWVRPGGLVQVVEGPAPK